MKRYAIILENAGENWAAYVPDLPGCVATGETVEEVGQTIREVIEMHIQGMLEDGIPVPDATTIHAIPQRKQGEPS